MAQLAEDADYQQRKAEFDAGLAVRTDALGAAEAPIVRSLHEVGVHVRSVWDLVNTLDPYPHALPVLLHHLEVGGYPERVMESLGRALAVKPAVAWWNRFKELYARARDDGEEDGLAVALAACATEAQYEDLVGFLSWEERGQTRIYFLAPIRQLGGARGMSLLRQLQKHPVFGREARALLRGAQ